MPQTLPQGANSPLHTQTRTNPLKTQEKAQQPKLPSRQKLQVSPPDKLKTKPKKEMALHTPPKAHIPPLQPSPALVLQNMAQGLKLRQPPPQLTRI